jgi:hypothetical protein
LHLDLNDFIVAVCAMRNLERIEIGFPQVWSRLYPFEGQLSAAIIARNARRDGTPLIQTLAFDNYSDPLEKSECFEALLTTGGLRALEVQYNVLDGSRNGVPAKVRISPSQYLFRFAHHGGHGTIKSVYLAEFEISVQANLESWFQEMPHQFEEIHFVHAFGDYIIELQFFIACANSLVLRVLDLNAYDLTSHGSVRIDFSKIVRECATLEVFRCRRCCILSHEATAIGAAAALNPNSKLHTLDLSEPMKWLPTGFVLEAERIVHRVFDCLMAIRDFLKGWPEVADPLIVEALDKWCGSWITAVAKAVGKDAVGPEALRSAKMYMPSAHRTMTALLRSNFLSDRIPLLYLPEELAKPRAEVLALDYVRESVVSAFAKLDAEFFARTMLQGTEEEIAAVFRNVEIAVAKAAPGLLENERAGIRSSQQARSGMLAFQAGVLVRNAGHIEKFFDENGDNGVSRRVFAFLG